MHDETNQVPLDFIFVVLLCFVLIQILNICFTFCVKSYIMLYSTGRYCSNNTEFADQYPCPVGTFNNLTNSEDSTACVMCSPGYHCPTTGMPEPAGLCSPGWYCILGSGSDKPTGLTGGKCLAGSYCPAGSDGPVPCDPGRYCLVDELDVVSGDCMAGYYCNGSTILPNPVNETTGDICPKGHYCPQGSAYPITCDPGYYSDRYGNQNETNCLRCTAGMYCSGYGRDLPDGYCDEGWFCPEGMTVPQPPGRQCLAGHECPVGSADQTPCPSGYYQPDVERGECLVCPGGLFCDRNEAISELQSGVSAPSHGVVTPKTCIAGFYCSNSTITERQYPCPIGTYSNTTNLESLGECRACPAGHYCEAENITQPTGPCTAGFYCVLSAITPTPSGPAEGGGPCEQGTSCMEASDWPQPCPKGTYGDRPMLPSLSDCTHCPPGEYCAQSSLPAPSGACLAGFYCTNGSQEANPVSQSYGDECPSGYYCPEHSYQPTACPAGTFQPHSQMTNQSACLSCDPGKYCNSTGQSEVSGDCFEGFYCIGGASSPAPTDGSTGDICPAGSFCPLGSPTHNHCPNGTYTNHTGAAQCYDCPEGHYCVNRDRADLCPMGYYCPETTGADLQPCPAGTYNPITGIRQSSDCTQCDGGMHCLTPALSAPSGNCSAGYYCRTG